MVPRWKLEQAIERRATTNLDDIRRLLRLGMGPCQGGFCIYRAAGILHGLDGLTAEQADDVAAALPAGAVEGGVADPVRRPASPGAPRRLDLPGRARRGASATVVEAEAVRVVRGELHYDAVVIGAGTAGLVAGARLAEGGARVCVLAKGVGSTHLAPGDDRRARLRARAGRRRRAARSTEFAAAHPDHPYALLGVDAVAEAVRWFRCARRVRAAARLPLRRRPRAQLPAADRGRRAAPVGARSRDDGRRRRRPALDRVCVVGTRALRDFHAALCASNLSRVGDRGALGRGRDRGRPRRPEHARAGAAVRRPRAGARRSRPGWR